jgi:YHS domain-containing protein
MARDLVCGMDVKEATAQWKSEYQERMYYFCSPGCKKAFDKNPEKYMTRASMHGEHSQHGHEHH